MPVTRRSLVNALALAAALWVGWGGPAGAADLEEESSKTLPATGSVRLVVINRSGDTVIRSWDRAEVQIDIVKRVRARNDDRAQKLMKELSVEIEPRGGDIHIEANYPDRGRRSIVDGVFSERERAVIDFTIHAPASARAALSTTSGDVEIHDLGGPVQVDCTSGDVRLTGIGNQITVDCTSGDVEVIDAKAPVEVRATSGDVTLEGIAGRVSVDATSGNITLKRAASGGEIGTMSGDLLASATEGAFRMTTSSGDAAVDSHRGPLTVKSSSGDLEITLSAPLDGHYRFDSSSGSVRVNLPRNPSCRLDLSTASGALHARLPLQVEEVTRNRLIAIAGTGGNLLEVSTASGDVNILASESE